MKTKIFKVVFLFIIIYSSAIQKIIAQSVESLTTIHLDKINGRDTLKYNVKNSDTISIRFDGVQDDQRTINVIYSYNPNYLEPFVPNRKYFIKGLDTIKFIAHRFADNTKKVEISTVNVFFINTFKENDASLPNSSFVYAALIKSIAGTNIPSNELIDIFVKLNIGKQKRWFSLFGVESGIGNNSTTGSSSNSSSSSSSNGSSSSSSGTTNSSSQLLRLNEATVTFNYAFYRSHIVKVNRNCYNTVLSKMNNKMRMDSFLAFNNAYYRCKNISDSLSKINVNYFDKILSRTAFLGLGLKLFNQGESYIGSHIGLLAINGPLFGSYILGGYYANTYRYGLKSTDLTINGTNSGQSYNYYRNNIYFEAGLNITSNSTGQFGTFFNSIRFKFGLMLPMRSSKDEIEPKSTDIISRVAIEIPMGVKRF